MDAQRIGDIAEIGCHGDFDAMRRKRVADRIGSIVGNGEARYIEIADCKAATGLKSFQRRLRITPYDVGRSAMREVNRDGMTTMFCQSRQAADMIVVLVGNQDGIKRVDIFADGSQALGNFAAAEAGIDQDASAIRSNESRITGAAARENANLNDA
jgi:hypothetical protein